MSHRIVIVCVLALCAAFHHGCGDDKATTPTDPDFTPLAGGGRSSPRDGFAGGPDVAGPGRPEFDLPGMGFWLLFHADRDCRQDPSNRMITDAADWQAWWTDAIACLLQPAYPLNGDPDGGEPDPDDPGCDPYPDVAPEVDFSENVVLVVALEEDNAPGRFVWIQDFQNGIVDYHIFSLGPDCLDWGWPYETPPEPNSPTIAVLAPRQGESDIVWRRHDTVFDCSWTPDPHEPITLYYTDTRCELGPETAVLRDSSAFTAWLDTAVACDEAAWSDWYDLPDRPHGRDGDEPPPDSTPPSPGWDWLVDAVDFTTHAVIILRGDEQDRWGGGIWLTGLAPGSNGTVIEYAVVRAGTDCPLIEHGVSLRPTVAIRVPLPLDEPVTWRRETHTIGCDWDDTWPPPTEPGDPGGPEPGDPGPGGPRPGDPEPGGPSLP